MTTCLIGHTGFVGGNLLCQHAFDHCYNSSNIKDISGRHYELLVCSGVSGEKWRANQNPEADWQRILDLWESLHQVTCDHAILISTIDVFPKLVGDDSPVDESFDCASLPNHHYGTHRLRFEEIFTSHFPHCSVIRLPGIFGQNLKKNVIHDLMCDHRLEKINLRSRFQWYGLDRLWHDIQVCLAHDIKLIVFATEPVAVQDIVEQFFPNKRIGQDAGASANYDVRTRYSHVFGGGNSGYMFDRKYVMEQISALIHTTV